MSQPDPRFQCRHIRPSGHRCGSPSLRKELFCYYHHETRKPIQNLQHRSGKQSSFTLPDPEDRATIQISIGEVLRRIAANDIDSKRAGLLLYGLQIASLNLPKPTAAEAPETIEEVIADPLHGPIAPESELHRAPRERTLQEILLEQWAKEDQQQRQDQQRENQAPETIHLQAVAAPEQTSPAPNLAPPRNHAAPHLRCTPPRFRIKECWSRFGQSSTISNSPPPVTRSYWSG